MVDVVTEINIDKPQAVVADYASDPSNATKWYSNIKTSKLLTRGPLGVGSQIRFSAQFLGRTLDYTYKVTELGPHKLVMRTADGPFEMETTYRWEAIDPDKTRMSLRNRGQPSGFSKIAAPIMKLAMVRANKKDLRRIKAMLEGPSG